MRRVLILLVVLLVAPATAGATDREWQTGKWAKPMPAPRVGTPSRYYAIESDLFRLDLMEEIGRGRQAVPALTATTDMPVTFAIEKTTVYVRLDENTERALDLIKRTENLKSYSAAGGGHFIKALANEGLTLTL